MSIEQYAVIMHYEHFVFLFSNCDLTDDQRKLVAERCCAFVFDYWHMRKKQKLGQNNLEALDTRFARLFRKQVQSHIDFKDPLRIRAAYQDGKLRPGLTLLTVGIDQAELESLSNYEALCAEFEKFIETESKKRITWK
jgi:hypothetical protein